MSRSFSWEVVKPNEDGQSISLRVAHALAEAFDLDDDIDGLEIVHTSIPTLRAINYLVNTEDSEDVKALIEAVSVSGGVVRFKVEW